MNTTNSEAIDSICGTTVDTVTAPPDEKNFYS